MRASFLLPIFIFSLRITSKHVLGVYVFSRKNGTHLQDWIFIPSHHSIWIYMLGLYLLIVADTYLPQNFNIVPISLFYTNTLSMAPIEPWMFQTISVNTWHYNCTLQKKNDPQLILIRCVYFEEVSSIRRTSTFLKLVSRFMKSRSSRL